MLIYSWDNFGGLIIGAKKHKSWYTKTLVETYLVNYKQLKIVDEARYR